MIWAYENRDEDIADELDELDECTHEIPLDLIDRLAALDKKFTFFRYEMEDGTVWLVEKVRYSKADRRAGHGRGCYKFWMTSD